MTVNLESVIATKSVLKSFSELAQKKAGEKTSGTSPTKKSEKTSKQGDLGSSLKNLKNQLENETDSVKKLLIKKVIDRLQGKK